jgi:hypothetical protein
VRWQHPERGLVGPDEFIGFAESRGLITPIGRWVMLEACRQLKAWQDQGLALVPVSVNLSALEFRQRDMATEVAAVLRQTGLEPRFWNGADRNRADAGRRTGALDPSSPAALGSASRSTTSAPAIPRWPTSSTP